MVQKSSGVLFKFLFNLEISQNNTFILIILTVLKAKNLKTYCKMVSKFVYEFTSTYYKKKIMYRRENLDATSAMVGRICPPWWG